LTGDDLRMHGLQPGPKFKTILQAVRNAQLDGELQTQVEAIKYIELIQCPPGP